MRAGTARKLSWRGLLWIAISLILTVGCSRASVTDVASLDVPDSAVARVVVFRADDCVHCDEVYDEILEPLKSRCGENLELKTVDIGTQAGYEAFVATEEALIGEAGRWEIPTVVVGDTYFIGQDAVRQQLLVHLECVYGSGGNAWPGVAALDEINAEQPEEVQGANPFAAEGGVESCVTDEESAICESSDPIFALYLTPRACLDSCDRTRYDLRYLQGVYPQLSFEERVIDENQDLAEALGEYLGVPAELRGIAPAVVIGEDYLVGEALTLDELRAALDKYADTGAKAVWYTLDLP